MHDRLGLTAASAARRHISRSGTSATRVTNVAAGGSDWIGRAVSGRPAFAFLLAAKLLFGLLDHPTGRAASKPAPTKGRQRTPLPAHCCAVPPHTVT
ncbi:hypothetical protein Dvina_20530 [Dactylosporangium vinaceum]|uniref:Uncharacterized protein n=1 Tax=Dactylosporangium vinaceum TaxID=53362 RepID=A0ABV5MS54_9ACTN|nr:hypothetical protein [Dactylosporangium vinaceum]UAC00234.1 hypothetical protein Dvina_20530 [Dactylosporangium vinaceum]